MPTWLKWTLGAAGVATFLWLDTNPRTSSSLYTVLGWILRAIVVWSAWVIASTSFARSNNPSRTALRAAGVLGVLMLLGATRAGCEEDPSCDPDPVYGGCPSLCNDVRMADRIMSAGVVLVLVGLPTFGAGWKHRRRFTVTGAVPPAPDSAGQSNGANAP